MTQNIGSHAQGWYAKLDMQDSLETETGIKAWGEFGGGIKISGIFYIFLKFILLFIQKKNDYNFMSIYYMKKLFVHKDNLIGLLKSEKADYAEQRG